MFRVSDQDKLLQAIRDQTQGVSNHLVFVLDIVSVRFGGKFTLKIKNQLEQYINLQMLTLNDCGINSLENFPQIPSLIRLDMVFNYIPGQDLKYLRPLKHIQTIMLGANKIQKLKDLESIKDFNQLLQLNLINNPIQKIPGYRNYVFDTFKSLVVLDTLDKGGKDAHTATSMLQTVARIPDNLFDKSTPVVFKPSLPITMSSSIVMMPKPANNKTKKLKKLQSLLGVKKSIDSPISDRSKNSSTTIKSGKATKKNMPKRTSKTGLIFPIGRIRRQIKSQISCQRVGTKSAVFMATSLQYLTAQILQIAGRYAKYQKKARITPQILKETIKKDEQFSKLLKNVVIGINDK